MLCYNKPKHNTINILRTFIRNLVISERFIMVLPTIENIGIFNSDLAPEKKGCHHSPKRKTTSFEIELPITVGGTTYIDEKPIEINPDTVICAKPNQIRHTEYPLNCYYIHINVQGELRDMIMDVPDNFLPNNVQVFKGIFENLVNYYISFDDNKHIILQSLVLELIYTLCKFSLRQNNSAIPSDKYRLIDDSLRYIDEHLNEALNLEKIAKQMSFSPAHFHKMFKSITGKNLADYIEGRRIEEAIKLLLKTKLPLTKIAYECGFSSQSYFSYVFKRRMKVTPREYVKMRASNYSLY